MKNEKDITIDDDFLDKTIQVWQPYTREKLTREDAREIIQNVCDLFDLLNQIKKEIEQCQTQP